MKKQCPCWSGKPYINCCQNFHNGGFPNNALELMRSRYSAYALGLAEYIIRTTHPDGQIYRHDKDIWVKDILHFCKSTEFKNLEIIEFIDGPEEAYVTFIAHLKQNGKLFQQHEKSHFKKVEPQWLYLEAN